MVAEPNQPVAIFPDGWLHGSRFQMSQVVALLAEL